MEEVIQEAIVSHLGTIAFLLLTSLLLNGIAYLGGFYRLPKESDPFLPPLSSLSFLKLAEVFALLLSVNAVISALVFTYLWLKKEGLFLDDAAFKQVLPPYFLSWVDLLFIFCSLGALLFYGYRGGATLWQAVAGKRGIRPSRRSLGDFGKGILTLFLCYPLVYLFNEIGEIFFNIGGIPAVEQAPVEKILTIKKNTPLFLATSLSVLAFVPLLEEILFRGYLQTWLKKKLGRVWAILLASLIFALFHYADSQGIRNLQFIVVLFIFSCFLGFIKERQQSIWAPFGLHVAFNAIALAAIYLKV